MTKAKTKTAAAPKAPKAAAPKVEPAEKKAPIQPEDALLVATLTVAQVFKQQVRVNVKQVSGDVSMAESSLFFSRNLLPGEYAFSEGREYSLVITRVK